MGRFAKYIGKLELNVAGEKFEIQPKVGDLKSLMGQKFDKMEPTQVFDFMSQFIYNLIDRDYTMIGEEKEELELLIEMNFIELQQQILVAFKLAKKEDFDAVLKKAKAEQKVKG